MVIMFIDDGKGNLWRAHYNGMGRYVTLETDWACLSTDIRPNTVTDALNQLRENMRTLFD